MEIILITTMPKEILVAKLYLSAVFHQMHGVYTICTEMCGNGVLIGMTQIIISVVLSATPKAHHPENLVYSVVVVGTTAESFVVVRTGATLRLRSSATLLAFALWFLSKEQRIIKRFIKGI